MVRAVKSLIQKEIRRTKRARVNGMMYISTSWCWPRKRKCWIELKFLKEKLIKVFYFKDGRKY